MAIDMQQIEAGENLSTEFKREYTDEIKKTIIAFANSEGGILYIGINDDKSIAGVINPDDAMLQITNVVRSAIKPDLTLFVECKKEKVKKATVIVVTVQKGCVRPYYLAGKGIRPEGVYVRQGASSVPASESAILNMIKETDGEKYEDLRSINQELTFHIAEQSFKKENVPFGSNQQKTLHLRTTNGIYTNLGLLFSDQSVHTVKLAVFEGIDKEVFKDRRDFSGSVLKQLEDVYEHLSIHNRTHAEVKGLVRQDKPDYPKDALREALLNALVHRDYAFSCSTLISVFDDRIEFVSIGGLPSGVSLDDILLGISVPRNENLANVFYRLHLIEVYGTGIPKIMRGYADCPRKPELQATSNAFKITLPNRNVIRHDMKRVKVAFSEKEEKIISMIKKQNEIVRRDVEIVLGISQAMAVRLLRGLLNKEAIRTIGGGKNTRYRRA
jgi:ATP-dependent DNA helicase RecG